MFGFDSRPPTNERKDTTMRIIGPPSATYATDYGQLLVQLARGLQ